MHTDLVLATVLDKCSRLSKNDACVPKTTLPYVVTAGAGGSEGRGGALLELQ